MGKATRGVGTTISKGTTTPTLIGGLTSIGGIEITAETMDTTTLDSLGAYREFIQTWKDGGEVPLEGYFLPEDTGQTAMQTALDSGAEEDYTITFPTTPSADWKFKGVVTGFTVGNVELDGAIAFATTVKVSGKPVLAIGTGV
jgi:hypothetical protein